MNLWMGSVICTKMASSTVTWSRPTFFSMSTVILSTAILDFQRKFLTWLWTPKKKTRNKKDRSMEPHTIWLQNCSKRMGCSLLLLIFGRWDVYCMRSRLVSPHFTRAASRSWFKWSKNLMYRQFKVLAPNSMIWSWNFSIKTRCKGFPGLSLNSTPFGKAPHHLTTSAKSKWSTQASPSSISTWKRYEA